VTDKRYKVYVRQPNVMNASQGAIKFYSWHAPAAPPKAELEVFTEACRLTSERFRAKFAARA
jgi:hypothetical protein